MVRLTPDPIVLLPLTLLDTLITSFPQTYNSQDDCVRDIMAREPKENQASPVSILEIIEEDLGTYDARPPITVGSLASVIINSCTGFLDRFRAPPILPILDIFDHTINDIVSVFC
jgi:hypothetical protein